MIRVSISNIHGKDFSATFADQDLADAWIVDQIALNSWGLPERWISFIGEPDAGYVDSRVNEFGPTEYKYAVEYTIAQEDVSAQALVETKLKEVDGDVNKGWEIKKQISSLMRSKLSAGTISLAEMAEFVERDAVKKVERYLGEGYLQLAKVIILSGDFDPVTAEEKAAIAAQL